MKSRKNGREYIKIKTVVKGLTNHGMGEIYVQITQDKNGSTFSLSDEESGFHVSLTALGYKLVKEGK